MKKSLISISFVFASLMMSCGNSGNVEANSSNEETKAVNDTVKCEAKTVDLVGEWNIVSADTVSTKEAENAAFIAFENENKMHGNTSVNSFFGEFKQNGNELSFSNVGATKMMGPHMEIEDAILKGINTAASFKVSNDTVVVCNADQAQVLVLVKKN